MDNQNRPQQPAPVMFANYILQGNMRAPLIALLFAALPLFGWFSYVIVAFVALRKTAVAGLWVLAWAILPSIVYIALGRVWPGVLNIVAGGLFIWLLATVLHKSASWLRVLQIAALIAIVGILLMHAIHPDLVGWWKNVINNYMQAQVSAAQKAGISAAEQQRLTHMYTTLKQQGWLNRAAMFATGVITTLMLASGLLHLIIARWWQAVAFNPGGLQKELHNLRFDYKLVVALGLCALAIWIGWTLAWDVLPVILLLFVISSLTLTHRIVRKAKSGWVWLLAFYSAVILLSPYSFGVLVLVGILDCIINFRGRLHLA